MADEERLIDAELLTTNIAQIAKACARSDAQKALVGRILFMIDNMPTIEAEPVKHGRWIKHRIDDPKSILYGAVKDTTCSICGKSTPYNTEYCMHCGARMDLKDGDSE